MGKKKLSREEILDMLTTAILHKSLSADFIVIRPAEYDQMANKVNNVILERKTGNIVCTFNEVENIRGSGYMEKEEKVLERNVKEAGTMLKYALIMEDGKAKPAPQIENIPVFYFALSEDSFEKAIKEYNPSREKMSNYENDIFDWFIYSINSQIKSLKSLASSNPLHPVLNNRLNLFEEAIKKYLIV